MWALYKFEIISLFQTYEEAQNKIDDDKDQEPLAQGLRRLLKLSKIMKQKRIDAGALQLASSEVRYIRAYLWTWAKIPESPNEISRLFYVLNSFVLFTFRFTVDSETADPIDVQTKQMRETNSMVEEFMLVSE